MLKRMLMLLSVLAVGACANVPKNPLTRDQIADLAIDRIELEMPDASQIRWEGGRTAYAKSIGCEPAEKEKFELERYIRRAPGECDYDEVIERPEAWAYVTDTVRMEFQNALNETIVPAFNGDRSVVARVTLRRLAVIGGGTALLFGGNDFVVADLEILDPESEVPVAEYPEIVVSGPPAGGIGGAIVSELTRDVKLHRLASYLAYRIRGWLKEPGDDQPA
ncbi:hypothetical protein [Oceanibacterium hippocampi]|uniref:Lipoprotein n=1 Tax=Oceanibacterium hippocampi TaxID=745714 RepID=A0A1Y5S7Y6_9PROT|nr:hypothetical protein [Oceanibacterium hippocampi]SLN34190.1 hypothetical protein OCH7691_01336 [Oceanibacterium hippocampi]